ncbi:S8 family serine peptidase [Rasiella sp. SM2506]|uniref:S8 family serine peptidase n=1 Tax=Rasiella sp. SM2506 TaxID=3423914 RepID=UPI003D7AAF7C
MQNKLFLGLFLSVFLATTVSGQLLKKNVSKSSQLSTTTNFIGPKDKAAFSAHQLSGNDKLKKMEAEFQARYIAKKEEALAYALIHNVPVRKTLEDGGFAELQFISEEGIPIYFRTFNSAAAASTRANWLHTGGGMGLQLNGDNLVAHVWDGGHARITHEDYDGAGGNNRVSLMDTGSEGGTQLNFHAAHVTGTIMGTGVGNFTPPFGTSKGMAWQSNVRGYMWNNDVAEATNQANDGTGGGTYNFGYDMLLSNHSYGYIAANIPNSWFGQYGADAVDWDSLMYNAPYYLMIVAAGNDGEDNTSNGNPLAGNTAYDKLSGHATAKNNLVVANANDAIINADGSLNSVLINSGSSEGPTDDYRIKPDITGNGTSLASSSETADDAYIALTGTSMASPNVAGTLLLLQEHYENIYNTPMRASTLKGLALHTADDPNANGPDVVYGWGLLNAKKAAEAITAADADGFAEVEELTLNQGQTYTVNVQANGSEPLLASISWTDPAGVQNNGTNSSTPALVNDLDLILDNGTTYYPWRLTGITANSQNNENNVDPFERVDITGASGIYTLTVSHDGALSSGSQDFALIITGGQIVGTTPLIAFGAISANSIENSECGFIDINIPVTISTGATENADVNFTINASSTATTGVDFDLNTLSITFPAGNTTSQNMTIRLYEDSFVETDETVQIDFTIDANGGDAVANSALDTFTLTITNDDTAITATTNFTLIDEDFEAGIPASWPTPIDSDGDGFNWSIATFDGVNPPAHLSSTQYISRSWISDDGSGASAALTPDNYLYTNQVTIPSNATSATLMYQVAPATIINTWFEEYYTVYWVVAPPVGTPYDLTWVQAQPQIKAGGIISQAIVTESINMLAYAGQTGQLFFRHHNCTDEEFIAIDDILFQATSEVDVQTALNTGSPDQLNLNDAGTVYSTNTTNGNIMMGIVNNQNDDYGCTDISVSRAGTGAQGYNGSTGPNQVMDKRFTIAPTSSIGSGDATMTFYIDATELSGWETTSGNTGGYTIYIGREFGGTLIDIVAATVGTFGSDTTLTGNFTGIEGDFYFGMQTAFISCPGLTKTWNGSIWSPAGAPSASNAVIINGTYNTSSGNIEACELTINGVVTVRANEYLNVQGNITVNGTLHVEHQGSVVQVVPTAIVTKDVAGTINVNITTPVLQQRAFMVMGSPMDLETRSGVFTNAFLVLDHAPNNFNPNTHPNIPQGATNFSDVEGDFWTSYTGAINPGEGYIVRPQTGYGDPAGITYDMTYSAGTLNNGLMSRPKIYNNLNSPAGTPNIYANPYPSAIDGDKFIQDNGLNELFFWEHLTPPSVIIPGEGLKFDMDDVSIRNFGGGVAANNDDPLNIPSNVISTGQGFAIKAIANGTIDFTNNMRLITGNTTLRVNEEEIDRLWLHIESDAYQLANNMMIGFNPLATAEIDNGYDTDRLACSVSIYSQPESGNTRLSIQTREAFRDDMKIPVGFSSILKEETSFTISLSNFEGSNLLDRAIYLYDNELNILTNLKQENYTFRSGLSEQDRRFTVVFEQDEEVLGTNEDSLESIAVYPNPTSGTLHIVSTSAPLEAVKVFDVLGREVANENLDNVQGYQLDMSRLKASVYFVEIITPQGTLVKRIVKK